MKKTWKYYDYCHEPYLPIAPVRGKLSSEALLNNSLLQSSCQKPFLAIIKRIKDAIGPWNTVWGVKLEAGRLTWEVYFYNHGIVDPHKTVGSLFKVLRLYFKIPAFAEIGIERLPYFMFSVDLSDDVFRSKQISNTHLYIESRSGESQGNSYYWGPDGTHLENHFEIFTMPGELDGLIHKVKNSVFLAKDSVAFLKNDLVKQLMPCHKVCVGNKTRKDGFYFSRVNVVQLLYFLKYFSYPEHIVDFVRSRQEKLDHLLYDVAFDVTLGPRGFDLSKSSYYGVF